jgi:hypothetical protein
MSVMRKVPHLQLALKLILQEILLSVQAAAVQETRT